MKRMRILIADDHAVVRKGLVQIISESFDMHVAAEACTGQEVLDQVQKNDFDVILLDINMPGKSGLDILKILKKEKPNIPVLILTIFPEDQYAMRVLKAGASGYLTKESAPDELITAIRTVSQGRKYITASLAEKMANHLEAGFKKPIHETLSNREFRVLRMIASGKTITEIADELCLSVKTVSTYRSRILEKTSMKNNAEIMQYAIRNHLAE